MYQKMQESSVQPDAHTFVAGLKACAREAVLIEGMLIHSQVLEKCFDAMLYVGNALIDLYGKCGNLQEARRLFDNQLERDIVTWNAILAGYVKSMQISAAFELFVRILQEEKADIFTYGSILKACSSKVALLEGSLTFLLIIDRGLEQEEFLGSIIIDMFAKCGCLEDALCVFEKLSKCDLVVWNALITGISQYNGLAHGYKTLEVFFKMMFQHGLMPDIVTFSSVLKACCNIGSLAQAKFIHTYVVERGFCSVTLVLNTLISVYVDCGRPYDAYKIFCGMQERDAITWNAIIAGYCQHGLLQEAFQLFQDSQQDCGGAPDMPSWNSLVAGYAQHGRGWEGIALFNRMQQEGLLPDKYTFIGVLNACACVGAAEMCRLFHFQILECSLMSDIFVVNSLIDMYSKCGILVMARNVFDRSPKQHTVTWNAMIGGYAVHGHHDMAHLLVQQMKKQECKPDTGTWNAMLAGLVHKGNLFEAFQVLAEMFREGTHPDDATFVTMVKGCSSVGALNLGKQTFVYATASNLDSNIAVRNSCIDMYAKCGVLKEALILFEKSQERDRVTWNTIIAAHALHAEVEISLAFFEGMQREGVKPDVATFAILLSACSRMGLLNEIHLFFSNMNAMYKVSPTLEHLNCLVDILGRAGQLSEAENILKALPMHMDSVGWIALLNNCNTYSNVELGRHCFDRVCSVDASLGSAFVIMSNILANAGCWDDLGKVQALRKSSAAWKKPGMAFIEVKDKLMKFTVGESFHSAAIYEKTRRLSIQLKYFGVPDVKVLSEQPAP